MYEAVMYYEFYFDFEVYFFQHRMTVPSNKCCWLITRVLTRSIK